MPFSHLVKPRRSDSSWSWKLHSSQLDLARSRRRSAGQDVSDMKRSVIMMSPADEGLEFEPLAVVVFESVGAPSVGAMDCWGAPAACPEGADPVGPCVVDPVGAGVKPMLEAIEEYAKDAETIKRQSARNAEGAAGAQHRVGAVDLGYLSSCSRAGGRAHNLLNPR